MLYRRRFKEELSNLDKDYLKSTVVGYLYNKDKSSIKKAKEFIVKLQNGNPDEIDIYIKNLIKMLPKPQVVYKRNKKKFDNFFQIIKDIVGENYSNLYELYKKNRIKKNNDLVFNSVYALLRILKPYLDNNTYMKFFEKTVQAEGDESISVMEDVVFGFFGIKNIIHNKLREKDNTLTDLFGDIKLALFEFDKLGALK